VTAPESPAPRARIIDRGYRRYGGPRTGVRGAATTVWRQSVQRALGLRRSAWAKVLPLAAVAISYVPAIVFVGLVALLPDVDASEIELPSYGDYFPYIQAAIILFIAFVGPEVLCTDRRTGMLGIYLASPLTRDTYLMAKALATFSVLALVTIGPPLLMLVANVLQGVGPDGPAGVAGTLGRVVGAGAVMAVLFTAVSMGVSALTDRKAFATAALLLMLVVSSLFLTVLVEATGISEGLQALSLIAGPFNLVQLIHGERPAIEEMTLAGAFAGVGAWTLLGAAVCRVRYQLLQVTR
jgi:ABC-2 type transport system permease protein